LISSALQLLCQFVQPSLYSVRLDVLERLIVHSCCSAIGFAARVGECQNVLAIHLVVYGIEAKARRFLRFVVQRRLQRIIKGRPFEVGFECGSELYREEHPYER